MVTLFFLRKQRKAGGKGVVYILKDREYLEKDFHSTLSYYIISFNHHSFWGDFHSHITDSKNFSICSGLPKYSNLGLTATKVSFLYCITQFLLMCSLLHWGLKFCKLTQEPNPCSHYHVCGKNILCQLTYAWFLKRQLVHSLGSSVVHLLVLKVLPSAMQVREKASKIFVSFLSSFPWTIS